MSAERMFICANQWELIKVIKRRNNTRHNVTALAALVRPEGMRSKLYERIERKGGIEKVKL